jgi:CheY-like chemotaxis protein/anti-sigma regulatory factor (Ser/Thr protein kinase)
LIIRSDRKLLRRIVQNFVSNALRYTRRGGVVIGARRRGDQVRIEVWDSGPGIPDEVRSRVFSDFERGPEGSPWGERGLGLGLAGCMRLARLMGAKLDLSSRADRGSMFYVSAARASLALARAETSGAAAQASAQASLSILVLDNEPEVLAAAAGLLTRWGHQVQTASAGSAALKLLQAQSFDLALVDHQLDAGENGIDLVLAWRKLGCAPGTIIMVSADRNEAFLQAAASAHLPVLHKPVKPAALRALVASLCG